MRNFGSLLLVLGIVGVLACSSDRPPGAPIPPAEDTSPGDTNRPDTTDAGGVDSSLDTPDSTIPDVTGADVSDGDGDAPIPLDCTNKKKDGTESDVDCGGSCPACPDGALCGKHDDCASRSCGKDGKCLAPSCTDSVANGDETDRDCGGSICGACPDLFKCKNPTDCLSKVCGSTTKTCTPATCTDGVLNGKESDIDCGGTCPTKCQPGKKCGAAGDCSTSICGSGSCLCPTGMVVMPAPGGGSYCIDVIEITNAQYYKFWIAGVLVGTQPAYCLWNTLFTPSGAWPPDLLPGKDAGYPVRYVDWCDAYAYCAWAGKRLCGKIGGGASVPTEYKDTSKSQWYNACSSNGTIVYPYSGTYDALKCNGAGAPTKPVWYVVDDAGTTYKNTSCQGGAPGLYQMSGNVAEWEDSCSASTGTSDTCQVRGGSYLSDSTGLRCDDGVTKARDTTSPDIGFRCCL